MAAVEFWVMEGGGLRVGMEGEEASSTSSSISSRREEKMPCVLVSLPPNSQPTPFHYPKFHRRHRHRHRRLKTLRPYRRRRRLQVRLLRPVRPRPAPPRPARPARRRAEEGVEMVLWELTAITAYFLGLRRTYRLALRIQRHLIPPNHPRIRDFVHRRTRDVFNIAVSVHKNIQERDIEVGRNLGNAILRWLDRMKPSAEIRPRLPGPPNGSSEQFKHLSSTSRSAGAQKTASKTSPPDSNGKMLFSRLNIRPKSFPVLPMMTQPNRISASSQCRRISSSPFPSLTAKRKALMEGVFRKDIAQLMV